MMTIAWTPKGQVWWPLLEQAGGTMVSSGIADTIRLAIEATYYIEPNNVGLTANEIFEVCERFGFQRGETNDTLNDLQRGNEVEAFWGEPHIRLADSYIYFAVSFFKFTSREPRNFKVMDWIIGEVVNEMKTQGVKRVSLKVESMKINAKEELGCSDLEFWSSIRLLEKYKVFKIENGFLEKASRHLTTDYIKRIVESTSPRKDGERFYAIKETAAEIIARRSDTRTTSTDPLVAFGELLKDLDAQKFTAWWQGLRAELANLNERRNCISSLVIASALCEGALTLLAASKIKDGRTMAKRLNEEPKHWKFHELIASACTGTEPVVNAALRERLMELNDMRKIIHAGCYVDNDKYKYVIPDIRPEQAKRSHETLEMLLRNMVNWIIANRGQKESPLTHKG